MKVFTCLFVVIISLSTTCFAKTSAPLSVDRAKNLAIEAYIYGYPLITMDMTKKIMTNTAKPQKGHAPVGQFVNMRQYPPASYKEVTTPNADTLYSVAWLDLSKEPYILHVPDENGRYYVMALLSNWTNVFAAPGTRTTGTEAQNFAIVGPHWQGKLPTDVKEIKSPTNIVWMIGRTYCNGTPEDYIKVHAIQDQYSLVPLSKYGKAYTPPEGVVNSNINMKTPVRDQVNAMDAVTYFKQLASLLKSTPPAKADAAMVAKLKKLGIIPGKEFDVNAKGFDAAKGVYEAVKPAQAKIMAQANKTGVVKNGWAISTKMGDYGTNYLLRAYVTATGLGANLPQDAIYPMTTVDSNGEKLNGKNNYLIHFEKNQLPPVNGFWSLTLYDTQLFFVPNRLNKHTISPRNHLITNKDGSIDLYIQHDWPGNDQEANWLPTPKEDFVLMFRFYWPKSAIINGSWVPPAVKKYEG